MKRILKSLGASFLLIWMGGCVTGQSLDPYQTRLYSASYDEVWLAALKALTDYPLKITNKDSGKIQSEVVNGPYNDLLFSYPGTIELPERYRYSLRLNFAKLATDDNQPVTRIRIIKDLERFNDFYTGWIAYPSDGLEEKLLLYRVEQILRIDKKLSQQAQQASP